MDKIIFCGYSFLLTEHEFRYLFMQNIRFGIDVVLYHNNDLWKYPDSNTANFLLEKRYADLCSSSRCRFYYEGSGDFFVRISEKWRLVDLVSCNIV